MGVRAFFELFSTSFFPAGENSTAVTITAVKDFVIEGDETVTFVLLESAPYGSDYTVGTPNIAEITIVDLINLIFGDSFEN